jgi:hypothetical protein
MAEVVRIFNVTVKSEVILHVMLVSIGASLDLGNVFVVGRRRLKLDFVLHLVLAPSKMSEYGPESSASW